MPSSCSSRPCPRSSSSTRTLPGRGNRWRASTLLVAAQSWPLPPLVASCELSRRRTCLLAGRRQTRSILSDSRSCCEAFQDRRIWRATQSPTHESGPRWMTEKPSGRRSCHSASGRGIGPGSVTRPLGPATMPIVGFACSGWTTRADGFAWRFNCHQTKPGRRRRSTAEHPGGTCAWLGSRTSVSGRSWSRRLEQRGESGDPRVASLSGRHGVESVAFAVICFVSSVTELKGLVFTV